MLRIILYILLFAFSTVILCSWGIIKAQNLQKDLLSILDSKGRKIILKSLKKNGPMSRKQLEKELSGISASLIYSRKKVVVQDPKFLTKKLLGTMIDSKELTVDRTLTPPRYNIF